MEILKHPWITNVFFTTRNSSPLKHHGWKTIHIPFGGVLADFSGAFWLVSGRQLHILDPIFWREVGFLVFGQPAFRHVSRSQETGDAENPAAQLMEEKDTEPRHWRRVPIEKDLPGTICYPVILWSCEYRSTISSQFNFEALSPKVRKTLWYLGKRFGARHDIFSYSHEEVKNLRILNITG